VLAYVFWHRPRDGVGAAEYEARLRAFHDSLEDASASFRLHALPFGGGPPGYEDWYLIDDWPALGELNRRAVDAAHRPGHDAAAGLTAAGWGGVYELLRGAAEPPPGVRWVDKPPGEPYEDFVAGLGADTVWRRQLVLGPAPELCAVTPDATGRRRV